MPDPTLSEAFKEAAASCLHDVVLIDTLELSHPALAAPVRLSKTLEAVTLGIGEAETAEFTPCGFTMSLPSSGQDGSQELAIGIVNVSRDIGAIIRACLTIPAPVQITHRIYRSDDLTQPANGTGLVLFLYDVVITAEQVTGRATFTEIINRKWPMSGAYYSNVRFPALQT